MPARWLRRLRHHNFDPDEATSNPVFAPILPKMYQKPDKTGENRKKPVETKEIRLTKRLEKPKVNCGTVLRTRMNIEEHAFGNGCFSPSIFRRARRAGPEIFILNVREKEQYMAKGMTKTALVRHMAEKLEITNKQAAAGLELLAETAVKETKKNGEFTIPGIGKLVKAERKARLGRNPQTGETIKIKAKTVVKFRVAKVAKDTIAPPKK
jgi:Bacterial nucleoid DNA-binding protein